MKSSKRYLASAKVTSVLDELSVSDAVAAVKKTPNAKFDESVDVAIRLGVDPRHADQVVRGTVRLPNGTGKTPKVLVLCNANKVDEAKSAGADYVGLGEYVEKIKGGWFDFDVIVATPDVMSEVGKLGKVLGPRGLMPNPKSGTVSMDVKNAVEELKAGKIEFRVDKAGIVHALVGKKSFTEQALTENINALFQTVVKLKPSTAKGTYVKSVFLSTTMGPSVKISRSAVTV
ncbi:MAG: 50S ribosomal protein L1 [Bacteroidetes bacterium]|nr:50S ribosomal protein L1 [Bacteroidota bacterium]